MYSMRSQSLLFLLFALAVSIVECINGDGDALMVWKGALADPNNVLESWDPTFINPRTWLHLTCNSQNRVNRMRLVNVGLSGTLVPQLGTLANLEYFDVSGNNISGTIPEKLGNLNRLVSLDLFQNQLTGHIPDSLGNMTNLKSLRLKGNKITVKVPANILRLVSSGSLSIMNVLDNNLEEENQ